MNNKKSAVLITSRFPWPLITGDRIRCFNVLKILSVEYNITLIILEGTENNSNYLHLLKKYTYELVELSPINKLKSTFNALTKLFTVNSLQESYYYRKELKNILKKRKFDLAFFHLTRSMSIFNFISAKKKVLDMCDPTSLTYKNLSLTLSYKNPWKYLSILESLLVKKSEKIAFKIFDLVFLHSKSDATEANLISQKLKISTMGVTNENLEINFKRNFDEKKIFFIGNLDYQPNFFGIDWFFSKVMIFLSKDFSIDIVGDGGTKLKCKYKNEKMRFWGKLLDCRNISKSASIGIAPLFVATGIQNKVLEYILAGMPVYCSRKVQLGLTPALHKYVTALDQNPKNWIKEINNFSYNPLNAKKAAKIVKDHYNWENIGNELLKQINKIN